MEFHIRPYDPTHLRALASFITVYQHAFPDAKLLPVEYYAYHPALDNGKRLWCAYDAAQRIVGFAPLFAAPVAVDHATDDPNRIWTIVLADPTLPACKSIRVALLQQVLTHAQQLAATFPPRPTHLCSDLMVSQQPDIQHLLDNGFRVFTIIDVLERATAIPFTLSAVPPGVTVSTTKLTNAAEQQQYLAAYNQCFPERSKNLTELRFLLDSPVWETGMVLVAQDAMQHLLGSILIYGGSQPRTAIIDDVFVIPAWRGQGLARHLLGASLIYCREHGLDSVRLEVRRDNTPALHLYTTMGYTHKNEELLLERTL